MTGVAERAAGLEEATLSALLIDPAQIVPVSSVLEASDFADPRHRLIFAAMLRLHEDGAPIDPHTLEAELARRDHLDGAGGRDYLVSIIDAVPTAANVVAHARLVLEHAQRRALVSAFKRGQLLAETTGAAPAAIATETRAALEPLVATTGSGRAECHSLAELLNDPTLTAPPAAILPPMGWEDRVTLLVGREKSGGKSTAASAAVALASQQGARVLYITLDEPLADTVARLHRFGADPANVYLMTTRPEDLGALVKELAVNAVVIDALSHYAAKDAPESGDAAGWTRVMMPIVAVARTHHVAVILIQHAGKATGEYRDSTAIGANVDVIITLVEKPDGTRKGTAIGRFAVPGFTVTINESGPPAFTMDNGAAPVGDEGAPALVQRQVLRLLQSAEPDGLKTTAWQQIANEAHVSRRSFFRARYALFTAGHASHQSTIYRVSPSGARWLASEGAS